MFKDIFNSFEDVKMFEDIVNSFVDIFKYLI